MRRVVQSLAALSVLSAVAACVEAPARQRSDPSLDGEQFLGDAGPDKPATGAALSPRDLPAPATRVLPAAQPAGRAGATSATPDAGSAPVAQPSAGAGPESAADGGGGEERAVQRLQPGAVVITELMVDPKALPDTAGEWFELHNPGPLPVDLAGCAIADGSAQRHAFVAARVLAPGAFASIARSEQPGFVPDLVASFSLKNAADTLALECGGVEIDRVAYDPARGFPLMSGVALSLDEQHLDAVSNDDGGSWCLASQAYAGDYGSPGRPNPRCSSPDDAGSQ